MSVIPFVMDGPNPTVVAKEDRFRPDGRSMLILNLDEGQLQGNHSKEISPTRAVICE